MLDHGAFFSKWVKESGYPSFKPEEYRAVLETSSLLSLGNQRVLDIGCGVGFAASRIKNLGAAQNFVVGLDLCQEALDEALTRGRIDEGIRAELTDTGLPPATFDVVVCWSVLIYVLKLKPALQEFSRLLRPRGELLIVDHHRRNPYSWLHFSRPQWVDRWLEGRENLPRRALDEKMVALESPNTLQWEDPRYFNLFTHHPDQRINAVHHIARETFAGIRSLTKAPWTANLIALLGRKETLRERMHKP